MKAELEHSIDNEKYKGRGKQRVLITNMESATDCTGKKLGTCQLGKNTKCYAECAEIQYPDCLPYRRRQARQWKARNGEWYHEQIAGIQSRARKKITHHRVNESGEMKSARCLAKLCKIARKNKDLGIKTFTYTSRHDLWAKYGTSHYMDISGVVVNGSGFMAHNEYRVVSEDYVAKEGEYWCPDKCYNCRMCKERLGITILSKARHTKKGG